MTGAPPIPLINEHNGEQSPTWSPNSKQLAFASKRDGNYHIWCLDIEDRSVKRLSHLDGNEFFPRWSPGDSTQIAFITNNQIVVISTNNDSVQILTDSSYLVKNICWDKAGNHIFFSDEHNIIYKIDTDSRIIEVVKELSMAGSYPAISPANSQYDTLIGTQLAYECSGGIYIYSFKDHDDRAVVLSGIHPCCGC